MNNLNFYMSIKDLSTTRRCIWIHCIIAFPTSEEMHPPCLSPPKVLEDVIWKNAFWGQRRTGFLDLLLGYLGVSRVSGIYHLNRGYRFHFPGDVLQKEVWASAPSLKLTIVYLVKLGGRGRSGSRAEERREKVRRIRKVIEERCVCISTMAVIDGGSRGIFDHLCHEPTDWFLQSLDLRLRKPTTSLQPSNPHSEAQPRI